MLIVGKPKTDLNNIKDLLMREFDMKDMGKSRKILGIEIVRK